MKRIFSLCSFIFSFLILNAQDVQLIMPYSSPLYFNPAFAGNTGCARVTGAYRNQWPNISGQNISSSISIDQYVKQVSGGFGITYFYNNVGFGMSKQKKISGVYSYQVSDSHKKWTACASQQFTYARNDYDYTVYVWNSPPVPAKGTISYVDLSSAMLFYSEIFYGGFIVEHLTEPETDLSGNTVLPMKYTAHAGANIKAGNVLVSPSIIYLEQHDYKSFFTNCAVQYKTIGASVGYRSGDNLVAALRFRTNNFSMGYAYDFSISRLGIVIAGSHELSLSIFFYRKKIPAEFLPFETAAF